MSSSLRYINTVPWARRRVIGRWARLWLRRGAAFLCSLCKFWPNSTLEWRNKRHFVVFLGPLWTPFGRRRRSRFTRHRVENLKANYSVANNCQQCVVVTTCSYIPRTCSSKHLTRWCRTSPTAQGSAVVKPFFSAKNGVIHVSAIESNRSSRIQVNLGPVSSIAGSELISRIFVWKGHEISDGAWLTRKSTPKSSNAFGIALHWGLASRHQFSVDLPGNEQGFPTRPWMCLPTRPAFE